MLTLPYEPHLYPSNPSETLFTVSEVTHVLCPSSDLSLGGQETLAGRGGVGG